MARLVNPYQRSKTGSLDVPKGLLRAFGAANRQA
jgi:hypothetical protein